MKKILKKGPDLATPLEEVYDCLVNNLRELRAESIFDGGIASKHIICLDFIHDSHWDRNDQGLGGKGTIYIHMA